MQKFNIDNFIYLVFFSVYRISSTRAMHAKSTTWIRALLQEISENHSGNRKEKSHEWISQISVLVSEYYRWSLLIHKPITFPCKDALITQDNKAYIFSEYVNYVNANYFYIIFKILITVKN